MSDKEQGVIKMKKIPDNIVYENAAQKFIEENIYDKYEFDFNVNYKYKSEILKANIIQHYWLEDIAKTLEGIC